MNLDVHQVSAFTKDMFAGNPAAVIPLEEWLPDNVMQDIAANINLAETAFVVEEAGGHRIRWFTPTIEVDLCGHATLASAFVLKNALGYSSWPLELASRSGPLQVDLDDTRLVLNFPAIPATKSTAPDGLDSALGCDTDQYFEAKNFQLVVLQSEHEVRGLTPDFKAVGALSEFGVIVTAASESFDFVSRFFAPSAGIDEDPVTGGAHCVLTPYWAGVTGKQQFHAAQVSTRGGEVFCELAGDRVLLGGDAVAFSSGRIELPESN